MSIATILAQTQAAEFTLHILRGRCAARPDRSPFLADEAAALRGQAIGDGAVFRVITRGSRTLFSPAGINPRWVREIWALSGLPGSATPACGKRCFSALSLSNSQIPRFQKS
jgi:hypothetical protein